MHVSVGTHTAFTRSSSSVTHGVAWAVHGLTITSTPELSLVHSRIPHDALLFSTAPLLRSFCWYRRPFSAAFHCSQAVFARRPHSFHSALHTSHFEMSLPKAAAFQNVPVMVATLDTSHLRYSHQNILIRKHIRLTSRCYCRTLLFPLRPSCGSHSRHVPLVKQPSDHLDPQTQPLA